MLEVKGLSTFYGNACALSDVSFKLEKEEIVSVIGANGAGKSTLMKSIMGVVKPRSGQIVYDGKDISHMPTHQIVKNGIVYVPEGRDVFTGLSVQDNLKMGAFSQRVSTKDMEARFEEMYEMFPRLKERRRQMAGTLSGGEQQMLAIARGLMSRPRIIMFDEPSLGLAPVIVEEVFDLIYRINTQMHLSVVLVEQNAFAALSIADHAYVLENGVVSMKGTGEQMLNDDGIRKAYLGIRE